MPGHEDPAWRSDRRHNETRTSSLPSGVLRSHGLVEMSIREGSTVHEVWFKDQEGNLAPCAESALAAALLPCMSTGSTLRVKGPVDSLFLAATARIQDLLLSWGLPFSKVAIEVAPTEERRPIQPAGQRVATFFSGGVDSFYTLLQHQEDITDLVFIHGFDFTLDNEKLRRQASDAAHTVAEKLGKNLIEVETNLRPFLVKYTAWKWAHGAALATVGLLLSQFVRKIYIPASHTYDERFPWGSHPDLDPLWSTSRLAFVHHGAEATRSQKVAVISRSDLALQTLRVCLENHRGDYNCGRCEKCLRTLLNLQIAGALDRCTTFREPLDPRRLSRVLVSNVNTVAFARENLAALEKIGSDPELVEALRRVLRRARWLGALSRFRSTLRAKSSLWRLADGFFRRMLGRSRPWKKANWQP